MAGSIAPGASEPAMFEAWALYRLERKEEAERLLNDVFAATPRRDETALAIAGHYGDLGVEEKRLEWLERVGNLSIRESQRAWALYEAGQFKEAVVPARKAIELDCRWSGRRRSLRGFYRRAGGGAAINPHGQNTP